MRFRSCALIAVSFVLATCTVFAAEPVPAATDKPLYAAEQTFQFVVTSDLYGGNRPGVFEHAVELINTLQPSFVMTVGDLIEGKDPAKKRGNAREAQATDELLNAQWDKFYVMLEPLNSRFYFVAGNHDYNYPSKAAVYEDRVGSPYYSFNFGRCHFLVINTNDGSGAQVGISLEQFEFIQKDLEANKDARHTFVFAHHPYFLDVPNAAQLPKKGIPGFIREINVNEQAWQRLEVALGDRPRTVFTGHLHQYIYASRGQGDYYVLATTGGGMKTGRPNSFDHIVLVTVRDGNPSVASIKLNGFVPQDLVTEKQARQQLLKALGKATQN
ncbi:MAG: hypothetical protein GWP08_14220 [Nitrospiraceae bacterium]|nr:hypothetical protein [Nitrospiraceae bacterium]